MLSLQSASSWQHFLTSSLRAEIIFQQLGDLPLPCPASSTAQPALGSSTLHIPTAFIWIKFQMNLEFEAGGSLTFCLKTRTALMITSGLELLLSAGASCLFLKQNHWEYSLYRYNLWRQEHVGIFRDRLSPSTCWNRKDQELLCSGGGGQCCHHSASSPALPGAGTFPYSWEG